MSRYVSVLFGAAVLATSLGVAQFATGQDLFVKDFAAKDLAATTSGISSINQADSVNRSSKSDRAASVVAISKNAGVSQLNASREISRQSEIGVRRPVACEAPASVLTDIAKQMASGRCIT